MPKKKNEIIEYIKRELKKAAEWQNEYAERHDLKNHAYHRGLVDGYLDVLHEMGHETLMVVIQSNKDPDFIRIKEIRIDNEVFFEGVQYGN